MLLTCWRCLLEQVRGLRVDRAAKHGVVARGEGTALALSAGCLFTRCRAAALVAADGATVWLWAKATRRPRATGRWAAPQRPSQEGDS